MERSLVRVVSFQSFNALRVVLPSESPVANMADQPTVLAVIVDFIVVPKRNIQTFPAPESLFNVLALN